MEDSHAAEATRQLRLAVLWRGYAKLLSAPTLRGLADEVIRRPWLAGLDDIASEICRGMEDTWRDEPARRIDPENVGRNLAATEAIGCWIATARALTGWPSIIVELGGDGPDVVARWDRLRQKLNDAKRSGWTVFGRRKDEGWLDDMIRQFDELRALAGPRTDAKRSADTAHRLRTGIAAVLDDAGPQWPPARLASLAQKLGAEWLNHLEDQIGQSEKLSAEFGSAMNDHQSALWMLGRLVLGASSYTVRRSENASSGDPAMAVRDLAIRLGRPAVREAVEKLAASALTKGDSTTALLAVLDALVQPVAGPTELEDWDSLLEHLRTWCTKLGCQVLPTEWSVRACPPFDLQEFPGAIAVAHFQKDVPRGVVYQLVSLGLKRGELEVRPASFAVSAGPPPDDFGELLAIARRQADANLLADALCRWPKAALDGTLENVAIKFFADYWGTSGQALRDGDQNTAAEFGRLLTGLMKKTFRLRTISPMRFDEQPSGWIEVSAGSPGRTGRVRAVLRPGLVDAEGRLRVPALVEVE